jgi:hypothetical protein
MFNGKSDPHQFIMSFEAAVASAGGNKMVLAKSFVIIYSEKRRTDLVFHAKAKHNVLLGEPPRQNPGKLQRFYQRIPDFHRSILVLAELRRSIKGLFSKVYTSQSEGS